MPACLELEDEIERLRQRLAVAGLVLAYSPGPNPRPDIERELRRWLAVAPRPDAAAGFRAGWASMARAVSPRLCEWEESWRRQAGENAGLRSHVGVLISEFGRLTDRG